MWTKDAERQLEANDLARTKWLIGTGLASCNLQNWNERLADDVVLSLRLSAVDVASTGNSLGYSGVFRAVGKKQSRRVLKGISSLSWLQLSSDFLVEPCLAGPVEKIGSRANQCAGGR